MRAILISTGNCSVRISLEGGLNVNMVLWEVIYQHPYLVPFELSSTEEI